MPIQARDWLARSTGLKDVVALNESSHLPRLESSFKISQEVLSRHAGRGRAIGDRWTRLHRIPHPLLSSGISNYPPTRNDPKILHHAILKPGTLGSLPDTSHGFNSTRKFVDSWKSKCGLLLSCRYWQGFFLLLLKGYKECNDKNQTCNIPLVRLRVVLLYKNLFLNTDKDLNTAKWHINV